MHERPIYLFYACAFPNPFIDPVWLGGLVYCLLLFPLTVISLFYVWIIRLIYLNVVIFAVPYSLQNKIRIFGTNVKSVLLYGSETWRVTKTNTNKLQTFINKCLRNVLQIRWPEMILNEELWERTGQEQIITEIKRRKWGWICHTLRKPATNTTRQALSWNPQGKRKVGRPRQTWRRSVEEELKAVGIRWSELGRTCQNRVRWRSIVTALCSPRNQEA